MAILRERRVWKRAPRPRGDRIDALTPEQRANVRRTMDILRTKHGDWKRVARVMGVSSQALMRALSGTGKPGAGVAVRAARLAGVTVEDVIGGAYAKAWVCPTCGRGAEQEKGPGAHRNGA
jgi:transcriptional regulator with XRE-family HTH domain